MTTAPAADQIALLDVQALDTRLSQLAHRRSTLPELAELEAVDARTTALADQLVAAQTLVGDIARELRKAEDDVELVRSRASRDSSRLESGQGTAKDLQALQHEMVSLGRRQSELEDVELEVMERAEQAGAEQARISADIDELAQTRTALSERLARSTAEIDAEVGRVTSEREQTVAALDDGLVALYDKVRSASGGIGAAPLKARRCEGCRLELPPSDLARILVRVPDSGV